MTNEQILEELRKLKAHNSTPTSGDLGEVDAEVAEIDESIADYNERIAELETKIADSNNYQYNENEEREFSVELLQESFASQLETIAREDSEYKSLSELTTKIFTDYNKEIEGLNFEIAAIERRIRKNEVAVRKNIGIRLTEQELSDLQADLAIKKERVALCEKMKAEYVLDLQNYGELITANNRKREVIIGKQERLNKILEDRKNHPITIDNHKLRLDKDELFRLKSGLVALQSRKEYITYNPNEEIDKLIAAISTGKNTEVSEEKTEETAPEMAELEDKSDKLVGLYGQGFEEGEPVAEEEEKKNDNTKIIAPVLPQFDDISSHSDTEGETPVEEEKKDDDEIEGLLVDPSDLDEEREAEIEEAQEELKEKKKDKAFIALWKKFSKKAKIITAAALAVGIVILARSCSTKAPTKPVDDNSNNISYTQTADDNENKKIDDIVETPSTTTNNVVKPSNEQKTSSSKVDTPTNEDKGPTTPSNPSTPDTPTIPDTPVTPDVPDTPVNPDPEPTKETETVKLEQGEAVASFDDIINGNINEDTVISHGDEIGKTTDGAKLKDYDENGQAEVELEKKDKETKSSSTSRSPEEIKKALEDFMGGEITFDHDDNQWLDEIQSGKTR